MTEPTAQSTAPAAKPSRALPLFALLLSVVAVVVSLGAANYVVEKLDHQPAATVSAAVELSGEIDRLAGRVDALAAALTDVQAEVPATSPLSEELLQRLNEVEKNVQKAAASTAAQDQKLEGAARLPLALALIRLEERFERGQNFAEALALLQKLLPAPLDEADATALDAAAPGVAPTTDLIVQLDTAERGLRRDARLALANNPLERVWAELQSLVLIRTDKVAENDKIGQALADLKSALVREDVTAFATAWAVLPVPSQERMKDWYAAAQRRLAAHAVLQKLAEDMLALPASAKE